MLVLSLILLLPSSINAINFFNIFVVNSILNTYIYIYIQREREREREVMLTMPFKHGIFELKNAKFELLRTCLFLFGPFLVQACVLYLSCLKSTILIESKSALNFNAK